MPVSLSIGWVRVACVVRVGAGTGIVLREVMVDGAGMVLGAGVKVVVVVLVLGERLVRRAGLVPLLLLLLLLVVVLLLVMVGAGVLLVLHKRP